MKILHIIYTHGVSGAEKYLDYLLPGLKKYGIDCDLMLICPPAKEAVLNKFAGALEAKGIKVTTIAAKRTMLLTTIKKIKSYLKQNDISIIHSHLLNTDILISLLKQFFYKKIFIISTKHGYDEKVLNTYSPDAYTVKRDLYYYVTKYTLKKIDRNIAISKGMADLFYNLKLSKQHFPVIHHGITVAEPKGVNTGESLRKANQQLIIAGRLEIMKGHQYLLEAMPAVLKQYPDCVLLILGEGSLKTTLQEKCDTLGIVNKVQFLGFQPDPYSYISHSDVIILPSLFEPFGLVYIEAHALKVPVVAFDTPAANELMINSQTGYLVPKFDKDELAAKILLLLNDSAEKQRIAENAYRQYRDKFTAEIMIKNTADWYLALNL